MEERVIETDVLVVGGGGAGFRAALAAREKNDATVVLLSKGPLARCGASPMAGADFTLDGKSLNRLGFPGAPHDTQEKFFNDIVLHGHHLNNQKLVEQYVVNAPARLKELLDWGLKVPNSEERAIFTSGVHLMDVLLRQVKKAGVTLLEDTILIDLVLRDGCVVGGLGLDVTTGEFIYFKSKAVVLATGGWHKGFWPNTGMRDLSGDGIAMAYRAGADIGNMEFITFCCNVLLAPPVWRGSIATYILSLRGGELTNSKGELFLEKYDPSMVRIGTATEWNKNFVSLVSMQEVRDGKGSPHGGVYYGIGNIPWETFERKALASFPNWRYKALDLTELARMLRMREPVEVGPVVEYFDGGIVVDEKLESTLRGLYAAGECTLGPFGANRVCSAITEMLVHGAEAGQNAAEYARQVKTFVEDSRAFQSSKEVAEAPLTPGDGVKVAPLRRRIQEMAHKYLGPIRNQDDLSLMLETLGDITANDLPNLKASSATPIYNKEWLDALELRNTTLLLTAAARSALCRTESRGVHFRADFPCTDNDNWLRENIVSCQDGSLRLQSRPATVTTLAPPAGRLPGLDMMKKMMEGHSDVGGHH